MGVVNTAREPATVLVRGASLAGMACAARLARLGHHVVLDADGLPDAGHWAAGLHLGVEVDQLPQTFRLPATWRDLFTKTGRPLPPELERRGLQMVEAPPQLHRFADGRLFALPSERGAQHAAVEQAFGAAAAQRWTGLLDELDELWMALRPMGLEEPFRPERLDRQRRAALMAQTSLDDLSERSGAPHLARIVRSQGALSGAAPGRNPALLAVTLAVHRRFGSWQVADAQARPLRASTMVDLLGRRLDLRGVERTGSPTPLLGSGLPDLSRISTAPRLEADARVEALPAQPTGFAGRRIGRPALAPTVRHQLLDETPGWLVEHQRQNPSAPPGIVELVDHSAGAPVVSWYRPLPDGRLAVTVHNHNEPRPDICWGLAATNFKGWAARPLVQAAAGDGPPLWRASAASHAGHQPWAELLTAALASYEVHEHLTGQDVRPSNRTPPKLARQARPRIR